MFLFWYDKILERYCITPLTEKDMNKIDSLIHFLKKEYEGFTYPRIKKKPIKTYRGHDVKFIPRLELIDCFHSGKSIADFYRDWI